MRQLLVWQVPLPPEERRGSSRLGGRFIVAEYKPLLEISWNAYDFASERAFNVRLTWRGKEGEHKARFRGELRLNVLARLLLCKQVGWDLISILNYASNLCFLLEGEGKETVAPLRAMGVKGTKKGEIGEFGTLVDTLFRIGEREMEKEEETRYQESIERKEGSLKIFFSRDEFVIYYLSSRNRYRRTADILEGR